MIRPLDACMCVSLFQMTPIDFCIFVDAFSRGVLFNHRVQLPTASMGKWMPICLGIHTTNSAIVTSARVVSNKMKMWKIDNVYRTNGKRKWYRINDVCRETNMKNMNNFTNAHKLRLYSAANVSRTKEKLLLTKWNEGNRSCVGREMTIQFDSRNKIQRSNGQWIANGPCMNAMWSTLWKSATTHI